MKTHPCPGLCDRDVSNRMFSCSDCWHRLPEQVQRSMLNTLWFDPEAHATAIEAARLWYRENPWAR
jgi:hypothetical protein